MNPGAGEVEEGSGKGEPSGPRESAGRLHLSLRSQEKSHDPRDSSHPGRQPGGRHGAV